MNIYNPIAKRVGDDIVIEYYDKAWLDAEKKTAVFHRGREYDIKNELVYIWKNTRIDKLFNEMLTTVGISLESIKDRLELRQDCKARCYKSVLSECICPKYFILKPEHKEEPHNELWDELYRILDDNTRTLGTKIAYIRTKFTIKRK